MESVEFLMKFKISWRLRNVIVPNNVTSESQQRDWSKWKKYGEWVEVSKQWFLLVLLFEYFVALAASAATRTTDCKQICKVMLILLCSINYKHRRDMTSVSLHRLSSITNHGYLRHDEFSFSIGASFHNEMREDRNTYVS